MGERQHGSRNDPVPVLITAAEPSYAEQYAARKRKYSILMSARLPCLALAGVFYQTWWLALSFLVLSVPLPWMAVLIANDRDPRKAEKVNVYRRPQQMLELERREYTVIDIEPGGPPSATGAASWTREHDHDKS